MNDDWKNVSKEYRQGLQFVKQEAWPTSKVIFWVFLCLIVVGMGLTTIGYVAGWFQEAAQVAQEEFGPRELLRKYEWFKDVAAQLDKKQADIKVYTTRFKSMEESYGTIPRVKWDRTDKEMYNLWTQEIAGVIASYNGLAAEYNAQMAKFNWRFTNAGMLPEGATQPLPREYKPYNYKM